jgi:pyruvate dehydrogenase E2 component (dihydrolipoamide acetyltransferase)
LPTDFLLPSLGENIAGGDVLRLLVNPGDTIQKDQAVLELETDKATIEVPSSVAGTITDVKVKVGEKVTVGQAILTVDSNAGAAAAASAAPATAAPAPATDAEASGANTQQKVTGDEPGLEQHAEGKRRPDEGDKSGTIESGAPAPAPRAAAQVVDINRGARQVAEPRQADRVAAPASPSVRRLARELGVDINQVSGSGPKGRISDDDVKEFAKGIITAAQSGKGGGGGAGIPTEPLPDFSKWGEVERVPMRAVRRKTAEHLSVAWLNIPHVTQQEYADITGLEDLRRRYRKTVEAAGGNLTVTAVAVKIVAAALKHFPQFNASIDVASGEIIQKKYVHIGVAVDTDRGLLVPVIRDADKKSLIQIAVDLSQLSEKARTRKIAAEEMQGGCFSISNLGGIGGSFFTPIVNSPEVAILGISRGRFTPVYDEASGEFTARQLLPLSLSYDHRVIDGADGIRFLRWVAEAFEQPFIMALHG